MKSYKGKFQPQNPSKYRGDPKAIIYRSGLELKLMSYLDKHPDVLAWSSEEVIIPYRSPIDGKVHRYFPDMWVRRKNRAGVVEELLLEVKPAKQIMPPKKPTRVGRGYLKELATYAVNTSKWESAEMFCEQRGWQFHLMSEKEINNL